MVGMFVLALFAFAGQLFGQTETKQRPTGYEALQNAYDQDKSGETPLILYPPGYLEWLYELGYNSLPVSETATLSSGSGGAMALDSEETQIPEYSLIDLGTLGGSSSQAYGINNLGQAIGYAATSSSGSNHAFLYKNGTMQDLGTLGGPFSGSYGINDSGLVVGNSRISTGNSFFHAFRWSNGSMEDLGTLGGDYSHANGINNNGLIVGESHTIGNTEKHAFLYSGGSMQDLGTLGGSISGASGINAGGQIVGTSRTNDVTGIYHAFLWQNGTMQDLGTLGGSYSDALGISDTGVVVGSAQTSGSQWRAFRWQDGVMEDLGTLGGTGSGAYGINSIGQVVGWSYTSGNSAQHAFLYSGGTMYDLTNLVVNLGGWILTDPRAINDKGQIVGNGWNPQGQNRGFLLNPLPVGWREAIEAEQPQPTYSDCPVKESGKDSLIVVTHVAIPTWETTAEESTAWVDHMTNIIQQYLDEQELDNWQVAGYKWIEGAESADKWDIIRDHVLERAEESGGYLGVFLGADGWNHIHFIGHSAGSALIQAATQVVKEISPSTTIHETFLDAYVGTQYEGRARYGYRADWSDSYFCYDADTINTGFLTFTSGSMNNAYNIDVTFLDTNKALVKGFVSPGEGLTGDVTAQCERTDSSHNWPVNFYSNTIVGAVTSEYEGSGFSLSKEGGDWDFATNQYVPAA